MVAGDPAAQLSGRSKFSLPQQVIFFWGVWRPDQRNEEDHQ